MHGFVIISIIGIEKHDLMVSEKKIFFTFYYCKSTGDDDSGAWLT